ncbi:sensor histidine kinase [Roseateles amylovorans]|uniref:histidine kinase n=1 Tax=Roseateles amylovorans TaxID=2978473 RepID=A0ABY6AVY1_9BURK|nr:HAMP domain-containing sensor histidine kinase [Roseateles amylovorans]UXH77157.1 HAMP domain-containing histidine kinase [Roseateles amylovorans]
MTYHSDLSTTMDHQLRAYRHFDLGDDDPDRLATRLVAAMPTASFARAGSWRPFVAELLTMSPFDSPMVSLADARREQLLEQGTSALSRHWARHEQSVKPAAVGLQAAETRRNDILALVAHELRDPLAAIGAALAVMDHRGNALDAAERAAIGRQLHLSVRLVGDLLDSSLVSRDTLTIHRKRVLLSDIIATALETTAPSRAAKHHALVVHLPDGPLWVYADTVRMSQVLGNLLSNAARYTDPRGRIEIRTEVHGDSVAVVVQDNGQGMTPQTLLRVFDAYYQGIRPAGSIYRGLGLGLALARAIVDLHDGTITAASAGPGLGSEFRVNLSVSIEPPRLDETVAASQPE